MFKFDTGFVDGANENEGYIPASCRSCQTGTFFSVGEWYEIKGFGSEKKGGETNILEKKRKTKTRNQTSKSCFGAVAGFIF